jgi:hypothetical protein
MDPIAASLFPNDKEEWFISLGQENAGPMRALDLYEKLTRGEVTYLQYVWREGMTGWSRVCDTPTFQVAAPEAPKAQPTPKPKVVAPPPPVIAREWFLYFNQNQMGPYSIEEAASVVRLQNLNADETFGWKDGLPGWELLTNLPLFAGRIASSGIASSGIASSGIASSGSASSGSASSGSSAQVTTSTASANSNGEKRSSPRKPLIAKVLIADGDQVFTGLCRDISVGGMQVLANYTPKKVGSALKMNVSPTAESTPQFLPFVAEGVVVRLFQDGRGFSFRFSEVSSQTKLVLDQIIQSS